MKKLTNILIKLIQMLGLLLLGSIVVILAPISMLVDGVKKEGVDLAFLKRDVIL